MALLFRAGCVLLVRRSQAVGTYRGRWAGVSGYLEADPLTQSYTEIQEETGLMPDRLALLKRGAPLEVEDEERGRRWRVYPFAFSTDSDAARLDWEHAEHRWVSPDELDQLDTVPRLADALARVTVLESRPALEGRRLAQALHEVGIRVQVIPDAQAVARNEGGPTHESRAFDSDSRVFAHPDGV